MTIDEEIKIAKLIFDMFDGLPAGEPITRQDLKQAALDFREELVNKKLREIFLKGGEE